MPEYVHGGDVYSYAEAYGGAPLDLSANINPFGIPEKVRQAMHAAVEDCTRYPDPFCRAARRAIGAAEGIKPDWLYCGSGAADVLDRLAAVLHPKTALLTAPTFAEYERTLAGADVRFHLLREDEGFAVTERILSDITPKIDVVYSSSPRAACSSVIVQIIAAWVRDITAWPSKPGKTPRGCSPRWTAYRRNTDGKVHHGAGHLFERRQKPAVRGALPHFPAGRLYGRAVQVTEHGAQFLHHRGR